MRLSAYWSGGCKGITKKGKPCQSKDVYSNGFCRLHGGEGTLPRLERLKQKNLHMIERLKKRFRRTDRKIAKATKGNPKLAEILELIKARKNAR